jgi:putative inorganic carbon (HCO3(-)) transporter
VATELQLAAIVVAAGAAAAALVLADGSRRAGAMLVALLAAAGGLATLVADSAHVRPVVALAAAGAGLAVLGVLVIVLRRRPEALALMVVAVLPFRVPVAYGDQTANLLVPLYVVIAAGCLAYAAGYLRRPELIERDRWAVRLQRALAIVLVLYAVQAVYSSDVELAVKNVCFFYVPFALLFGLVADLRWSGKLLAQCFGVTVALAIVFAAIGYVEYATGHLLITNEKVLSANELKPYFRVNSLFFDPNIYGRFLGLTMIGLAAALLWRARGRTLLLTGVALAALWGGLVLSLSQSSFAALLVGLAILAGLRWRPGATAAAAALVVAGAVAVVALSPASVGLATSNEKSLNRATSGRVKLTEGALDMARDRPVWGYGSGAFSDQYRERRKLRSRRALAESHTIPLTVAAEQGIIGLAAYLALLAVALGAAFSGVRRAVAGERPEIPAVAAAAVAAAFCALVIHTFIYASFLEDPTSWLLLGLAAALGGARRREPQPAGEHEPA